MSKTSPFKGQYADAQHNAMDAVLKRAALNFHEERKMKAPKDPSLMVAAFLIAEPTATFSASLASAMNDLGLKLTEVTPAKASK